MKTTMKKISKLYIVTLIIFVSTLLFSVNHSFAYVVWGDDDQRTEPQTEETSPSEERDYQEWCLKMYNVIDYSLNGEQIFSTDTDIEKVEKAEYENNCFNSDGTPKYSSQPSKQSNTPTPTNPPQNTPETPSQNPESETPSQDTPTSSPTEHCRYFLGMVSWDCNVSLLNQDENISQDDLGSSIWTIAANIATDITVIAAYLVVGYIIYGGYLYIFSAGDTNKTVTGKKAIHQALLGLAIVLSANIILNGIRIGLVGSGFSNCVTNECIEPADMVKNALEWVIGISGAVSAIFIVYGGTSYTMSRGDANKVQTAKQIITYALIGMIIVTLAELIVIFASNIINSANNTAYLDTNQMSIIKEYHET